MGRRIQVQFAAFAILAFITITAVQYLYQQENGFLAIKGKINDDEEINNEESRTLEVYATLTMASTHSATVRVFNFQTDRYYSVLGLSFGKYTLAGTQTAPNGKPKQLAVDNFDTSNTAGGLNNATTTTTTDYIEFLLDFLSKDTVAQDYQVHVYETEMLPGSHSKKSLPSLLVEPSPFSVTILPGSLSSATKTLAQLPPCQSVAHDALLSWNGHWAGPEDSSTAERMRTGWSFVPESCRMDIFSPEQVVAAADTNPTTVAVLGTSRERGVFLSMVDLALRKDEKEELKTSKVGKCWGRATIKINNLKLIYQDMRTHVLDENEEANSVTCHAGNIALGSGMYQNATEMLSNLFETEKPQVIVFWSGCFTSSWIAKNKFENLDCVRRLVAMMKQLPPSWNGTVYVTEGFMNANDPVLSGDLLPVYLRNLQTMSRLINDTRVRLVELHTLVSPMRLFAERPGMIRGSTHWHGWCNLPENDIRVCSNITEALGQLVLGRALAPEGKSTLELESSIISKRTLEVCTDCPKDLLPMHIKVEPQLTCYKKRLVSAARTGDPVFLICPQECMEQEPTGQVETQSGPVDLRVCELNHTAMHEVGIKRKGKSHVSRLGGRS